MARPRNDSPEPSAKSRIDAAFWEMLSRMPFTKITIRGISAEADVNHNTFYRHYENTEGLALSQLEELIDRPTAKRMAAAFQGDATGVGLVGDADFAERFPGVVLFARCGSLELQEALVCKISSTWLSAYGIEECELTPDEAFDIELLFRIVVNMLGSDTVDLTPDRLSRLLSRDLGKGMVRTLTNVLDAHGE